MVAGLEYLHFLVVSPVHQPMLIIDPARPVAGKVSFQRLGLPDAAERIALDLLNQPRDPHRHLPIRTEPEQEVFPRVRIEVNTPHASPARDSISSIVLATEDVPALSRATASMSRRALAGDRSR